MYQKKRSFWYRHQNVWTRYHSGGPACPTTTVLYCTSISTRSFDLIFEKLPAAEKECGVVFCVMQVFLTDARFVLIVAWAACLGHASGETLCNNSLFQIPAQWGSSTSGWGNAFSNLKQATDAVPPPSHVSAVCKYYATRPEVCCSKDTLEAIECVREVVAIYTCCPGCLIAPCGGRTCFYLF